MSQRTQLETLETIATNDDNHKIIPEFSEKNIGEMVLDFELSEQQLLLAMEFYYSQKGEETLELINRLISLYNVSQSFKILQYLKGVCLLESLPLEMRLYLCKELCGYKYDENCYSIMSTLCRHMKENKVCTTSRIDYILVLFKSKDQAGVATSLVSEIINDTKLSCKYRFSIIKQLPSEDLCNSFYVEFLKNTNNEGMYRVLAGQTTMIKKYDLETVQRLLYELSIDETQEYNLRADATDVILRYGDAFYKSLAETVIKTLGSVGGKPSTIYENAQNAHISTIEESAVAILSSLYNEPIFKDEKGEAITFDYVQADILKRVNETQKYIIAAVLNRISLDQALYSKLCISLKNALTLVYSYILRREHGLFNNLVSELIESHGICSTGIMERIANSLSGYEDFMVRISFEEQIKGNLHGRLNARIKNLANVKCIHSKLCDCIEGSCYVSKMSINKRSGEPCGKCANCLNVYCIHECNKGCNEGDNEVDCDWNTIFQEKVFSEMIIPTSKPQLRVNFLSVYRLYISEIMEEMRKEFLEYIDLASFDLYFRKAMMNYDCA